MKKSVKRALLAGLIALQAVLIVLIALLAAGVFGIRGEKGERGDTPFIGENGHWWIGGEDTGVPAQGEQGDKGDKGDSYTGEHNWTVSFTVEARCEEPGVIFYGCLDCKETRIEPLEPLGHDYEDGVCSRCFQLQPDEGLRFRKTADSTGYLVTGIGSCSKTDIVVPANHEGLPVVGLADSAFQNRSELTGISLPDSILTIGLNAFQGCSSLLSAELPAGVTMVEDELFHGCAALRKVTLPAGVHTIGRSAFAGCGSLTELALPEGLTTLKERAFSGSGLESAVLPERITVLPTGLFQDCEKLVRVEFSGKIVRAENSVFYGCTGLQQISLEHAETVGESAFYGCENLRAAVFGKDLSSLGKWAFYGCGSLGEIELSEKVESIGAETFRGCVSLRGITLPKNLTKIGDRAFFDCAALSAIRIPANVTEIGECAFQNCSALESAEFASPDGWTAFKTGGTEAIPEQDLKDPATAARFLTSRYLSAYWRR